MTDFKNPIIVSGKILTSHNSICNLAGNPIPFPALQRKKGWFLGIDEKTKIAIVSNHEFKYKKEAWFDFTIMADNIASFIKAARYICVDEETIRKYVEDYIPNCSKKEIS